MHASRCQHCEGRGKAAFDIPFTAAFQPIFDLARNEIFAHEALVRPPGGGSAMAILSQVTAENRYSFDQACRVKAIEQAARMGIREKLSINVYPNAVYDPDTCIAKTLWAAERYGMPLDALIFEFTESEQVADVGHLKHIIERYRARGFRTAFDDFGAGYAGLGLLAALQPDIIKIDMQLIRNIDTDRVRQGILRSLCAMASGLGITIIAEGIETEAELRFLMQCGVTLIQGYLLARPRLEGLVGADEIRAVLEPMHIMA